MKVTVGPSSNLVFQSATDRGGSPAQITVTSNTGPKVVTVLTGGGGIGAAGEAYNQANSARDTANGAYSQANGAYGQANAAYSEANLKLNITGGTITGNLVISGNLEVLGNGTILNVETLMVEDNEIILNSNVTGAPTLNAFITIDRGTSPNAQLKWDESTGQWKWSDGDNIFYAFDSALDAYGQANAAFSSANNRVLRAGDTMTGNLNVAATLITQNVIPSGNNLYSLGGPENRFKDLYVGGNTVYIGEAILSSEGTEVRTETFNATVSFVSGGLNVLNQANSAYNTANAAYNDANTRVLRAGDTMNGTLNISMTGIGLNVNAQSQFSNTVTISNPVTGNGQLTVTGSANVRDTVSTNTVNFGFGVYDLSSNTFQTNSNDLIEVDSFPSASYSTVKYIVQVKSNGVNLHSTELFCIQDGVSTYLTEYATLVSGASLGTFSINLVGGRMNLNFNPDNPSNHILTFKVVRYTISS